MRAFLLLLLGCLAAFGAADDWPKVKALKSGSELRVYKKGSVQPVSAQMSELTDDNLVVIVKNSETAIPRDQIVRIDARPPAGRRWTKNSSTKDEVGPDGKQNSSESTGYSMGSRPDFETVYREAPPAPKK